ncbi:MAG: hypothetical protein ACYCWW_14335 [Deltaproteobacteria bacterium]
MLALLVPLLLSQASPPSPAGVAPPQGQPVGAYPADEPTVTKHEGRRALEIDLYVGPSYSSSGDLGLGVRASVVNHEATPKSFGLKWFAAGGGGYYALGPGVQNQVELLGNAEVGVGYLGIQGLEDGTAPQAFVNFFSLAADVLTEVQSIYSYTPNLQVGLLGRDAASASTWNVHLHLGGNLSYVTGQLEKLGPSGQPVSWLVDPWAQLSLLTDLHVTDRVFLRLGANVGDTLDSLGPAGFRHIIESRLHAYLKIGPTLWTGPALVLDDIGREADFATGAYVPAPAVYTLSWLIGGALG